MVFYMKPSILLFFVCVIHMKTIDLLYIFILSYENHRFSQFCVLFFKWNYRFVNFVLWFVIRIHRFLQIVYFCIWNYGFSKNCIVFLYESVDFVQTFFRVFDENHRFSNLLYGFVLWNHRFPNCLYSVSYEIIVFDNLFLVCSICSHIFYQTIFF